LGIDGFGPVKRDFYELLCLRRAPKKEALFQELRAVIERLNRELPGAERKCVSRQRSCAHHAPSL